MLMYLILITEAKNKSLIGSIWEIDEKGETAVCIAPNNSSFKTNCKIPCSLLGNYSSRRLERLDEELK